MMIFCALDDRHFDDIAGLRKDQGNFLAIDYIAFIMKSWKPLKKPTINF